MNKMPTYPTGAQNLDLLESLKENYSQYIPGFQGDPNSVTDFMRHLGSQGVEGMGVGKENRADLLGLNQPNLAQPAVANDVQTMAPIEVTAPGSPMPEMDIRRNDPTASLAQKGKPLESYTRDMISSPMFQRTIDTRPPGLDGQPVNKVSAPMYERETPFSVEKLLGEEGSFKEDFKSLMSRSGELTGMEKFQQKFRGYQDTWGKNMASSKENQVSLRDIASKFAPKKKEGFLSEPEMGYDSSFMDDLKGKMGDVRKKFAPLDKKLTGLMEKGSKLSAKLAGPMDAIEMFAGGQEAGKATDKALGKVKEGFATLHGMRGDAISDYDAYMDLAEDSFKSTVAQQGNLANKTLKDAQGKLTSNIGTGSIQKSARGVRDTLASGMKHTVDASKAKLEAAELKGLATRRRDMADITESVKDLKVVEKQLKKKKKLEKLVGGVDKLIAGGTLALDVVTGGTAGSAVRGGYKLGKSFLGV